MVRRPVSILFVVAVVLACIAVLPFQQACADFPDKTCFGDKVNALTDDGGTDPRTSECTTCLQRTECCDVVGACGDDPECTDEFRAAQHCVLATGKETDCKAKLVHEKSKALYACVRKPCGPSCGIPSCDLNQAVPLIGNPTCDRCMGGACCEQINACYNSRRCKLFLECVTNHCPRTLGLSMATVGQLPPEFIDSASAALCASSDGGTPPPSDVQNKLDPGPCISRCLGEFTLPEAGIDDDTVAAQCLAIQVYTCGAKNQCGSGCTGAASILSYPEDRVADAGSDGEPDAGADAGSDAGDSGTE